MISQASTLREPTEFMQIQDLLKAAANGLRSSIAALADDEITRIAAELVPLGTGANSIFARHARETFIATRADATIDENVAIQRDLDETVTNLVKDTQRGVEHSTSALSENLNHSRVVLPIVAFVGIIAAAGVGMLYVRRRLGRRLISISDAMPTRIRFHGRLIRMQMDSIAEVMDVHHARQASPK
jgi:hypothetical protein